MAKAIPYKVTPDYLRGDILMVMGPNGGDLVVEGGDLKMTGGFETEAVNAFFGGNPEDPGLGDMTDTWWGNLGERDPARHLRGRTQNLLDTLPATSENLKKLEAEAARDLSYFLSRKIASTVTVSASLPARNVFRISGEIRADGPETAFDFTENWKAQAEQFAGVDIQNNPIKPRALNFWVDDDGFLYQNSNGESYRLGG